MARTARTAGTLFERLNAVLAGDFTRLTWPPLGQCEPVDRADRLRTLLAIYQLDGDRSRWAGHPAVAELKLTLEDEWRAELDAHAETLDLTGTPVQAMRSLAARERLPRVYKWAADRATLPELRDFLAAEGGPDGGFDDLVAACQMGLSGGPKMELARNYWDEMGNGDLAQVHTDLHRVMARALGIEQTPVALMPTAGLARTALGGLFSTNKWLQPEMIGALGLTELQAGPRCRLVLKAFRRLGVPREAEPFYSVHADVDPRHGQDWLDNVVAPLARDRPEWGVRMVRGAAWRWLVNAELFDALLPEATEPAAA
jgi:hypothetical protein